MDVVGWKKMETRSIIISTPPLLLILITAYVFIYVLLLVAV